MGSLFESKWYRLTVQAALSWAVFFFSVVEFVLFYGEKAGREFLFSAGPAACAARSKHPSSMPPPPCLFAVQFPLEFARGLLLYPTLYDSDRCTKQIIAKRSPAA